MNDNTLPVSMPLACCHWSVRRQPGLSTTPKHVSNFTLDGAAVRLLRPVQMQSRDLMVWRGMVAENSQLSSPFFSPEYALAVARVIPQVCIGIVDQAGSPVAFLAFEHGADGIGRRLRLCDYQGLVSMPEPSLDIRWFIRECGLRAWDFDHLLAEQEVFGRFHRTIQASHVIDLARGFEVYVEERCAAGTKQIKKSRDLERRLQRDHGQIRFALHVGDPAILAQLLEWRSSKYQVSRHRPEVVAGILKELLLEQSADCQGTLSVLYVNDRVAACHFGLRSSRTWHYWFPAYNPDFEKYSPGTILLIKMAEIASTLGITTIDLGGGDQDYKRRFANRAIPIAEGFVSASSWLSLARNFIYGTRRCLHRAPALRALAGKSLRRLW